MDNFFNQMVEIIKLNKTIGQIAIKAEFESEGTRMSELLSLKATANLYGDIVTNKLSIEPGANFTGSCSMGASVKNMSLSESNDKSKEKSA